MSGLSPSKEAFEEAASELGINVSLVEKDWYVTQLLVFLSKQHFPGFELVFSGGTALAKAHGLIQRFSEDVDFRAISYELSPGRKKLSDFKHEVVAALKAAGFTVTDLEAKDNNRFFTLNIEYETQFDPNKALRPHIKFEVKVIDSQIPAIKATVSSMLTTLMKGNAEVISINCIDPVETAADKLSALVWRIPARIRGEQGDDPSIVRHIHDLAALEKIVEHDDRFPYMVETSMSHDNETLLKNKPLSEASHIVKIERMLDILSHDAEYEKEYDQFVKGMSYANEGEQLNFKAALESLKRLAKIVIR